LVDVGSDKAAAESSTTVQRDDASMATTLVDRYPDESVSEDAQTVKDGGADADGSLKKRKPWFGRRPSQPSSEKSSVLSSGSLQSVLDYDDDDIHVPLRIKEIDQGSTWGVGDDAQMSFG
jgi:hypothetical protein